MANTQVNFRVDEETLNQAKEVLNGMNTSVSSYLQLMLKKVVIDKGFTVSTTPELLTVEADEDQTAMVGKLTVAETIEGK